MSWHALGLSLAEKVCSEGVEAFFNIFRGPSFIDALEDAIEQININTKRAIANAKRSELEAKYNALVRQFNEYINVRNEISLNFLSWEINDLVSQLKILDLYDPDGPGLFGHPLFMVAANLKIAIHQERTKVYGDAEKRNEINFINEAVTHAYEMHRGWYLWSNSRFGPLRMFPQYDWGNFQYKFEGKSYYIGCIQVGDAIVDPDPPGEVITWEQAKDKREDHMQKEWLKIYGEFALPAGKIIKQWENRLEVLEFNFEAIRAIIGNLDHYTGIIIPR